MESVGVWPGRLIEAIARTIANWLTRCVPEYQPTAWKDEIGIQYNNNCYNYSTNMHTGTYAQPGRAMGEMYGAISCEEVGSAAVADGLTSVVYDTGCGCFKCCHRVALVIWPGVDYHWYRQDRDGRWSHKLGGSPATNLDNSGNLITDPRTADRGPYIVFCGCYCVCQGKVSIE